MLCEMKQVVAHLTNKGNQKQPETSVLSEKRRILNATLMIWKKFFQNLFYAINVFSLYDIFKR